MRGDENNMTEKEMLKAEIDKIDSKNAIEKILCFVIGISTQQKIEQSCRPPEQMNLFEGSKKEQLAKTT